MFVFHKKLGVCLGKANLTNLMMKMAGIPSLVVITRTHAYNAIFLDDIDINSENGARKGVAVMDPTWAFDDSDNPEKMDPKEQMQMYFPAFYKSDRLEDSNKEIVDESYHQIEYFSTEYIGEDKSTDGLGFGLINPEKNTNLDLCINLDGKPYLKVSPLDWSKDQALNLADLPKEFLDSGVEFEIETGNFKTIILTGNEKINIRNYRGLQKLDISKSTRYEIQDGKVVDKSTGKELEISSKHYYDIEVIGKNGKKFTISVSASEN